MSAAELGRRLKVPTNRITGILNGQRAVTGDSALRLAHFFGTSPEFWLNLQKLYELRLAKVLPEEEFRILDEGYRFLRSLEVGLRLSQDASIERFDPSSLDPETRDRYRNVTERVRGVYLRVLGVAD